MAKLLSGNTRITIENQYTGREVYDATMLSITSVDRGESYQIGVSKATPVREPWERAITEEASTTPEDPRKKLIESHTSVLTDVLKAAETTKLNSAIKRERVEQEIAAQERADRIAMMFAVNNAIQAGLSEEEVTADMCDGWASYVCDMYGHVYTATDLDTVVNKK